ncbi:MAG: hypothetical protein Q7T10_18740 [Rhodoferax sp.]|uniref:hypothetical protein n=1 Tax=Rhodoferax sp. TaxID=50421 RepID=UPI002724FCC6|nr:hypothetical protein [Rhodoferax sp.]MDO8450834.1 hypothetical protein [Rhodoferax sp.]
MVTVTGNTSLTGDLKFFVDNRIKTRGASTTSEPMRDLTDSRPFLDFYLVISRRNPPSPHLCHHFPPLDVDQKRAVHLAFDHDKLMRVTRSFARDHELALPEGYDKSRQVGQITLYEQEQSRQTGLTKKDHIREVTEAWQQSDDPRSFVQALAERGYTR